MASGSESGYNSRIDYEIWPRQSGNLNQPRFFLRYSASRGPTRPITMPPTTDVEASSSLSRVMMENMMVANVTMPTNHAV